MTRPTCLGLYGDRLAGQGSRDRASRTMSLAMRRRCARALRTAPGGLERSETRPLMLFQQPTKLGVLRSQKSLCVAHNAVILGRYLPNAQHRFERYGARRRLRMRGQVGYTYWIEDGARRVR